MNLRLGKHEKVYRVRTCMIEVLIKQKEIGLLLMGWMRTTTDCRQQKTELSFWDSKVVLIMDVSKVLSGDTLITIHSSV